MSGGEGRSHSRNASLHLNDLCSKNSSNYFYHNICAQLFLLRLQNGGLSINKMHTFIQHFAKMQYLMEPNVRVYLCETITTFFTTFYSCSRFSFQSNFPAATHVSPAALFLLLILRHLLLLPLHLKAEETFCSYLLGFWPCLTLWSLGHFHLSRPVSWWRFYWIFSSVLRSHSLSVKHTHLHKHTHTLRLPAESF